MTRVKTSLAMTEAEVDAEWRAYDKGCACHTCRIINGKPEPYHHTQMDWLFDISP